MSQKRKIILVLCFLVMGIAGAYLGYTFFSYRNNNRIYEQMKATAPTAMNMEITIPTTAPTTAPTEAPTEETEPVTEATEPKEPYVSPVDFDALQEVNSDIYAWITVEDTTISYPLLQNAEDSDYYLNHTVEKTDGYPGALYTQNITNKDFSDFNSIIYGHNMTSGAMFGTLENFRDQEFFDSHRTITIYTPDATRTYEVFAAVLYNDWLINRLFDFNTEEGRMDFIASLDEQRNLNNHILTDVEITPEDHIITLSTCAAGNHDYRYLVCAVLTNVED